MSHTTPAQLFKLLSHPTRLAILEILRDGEQCVCHMEAVSGLRQAHISQHLMLLREAGLVADRRDGWNIFYHVTQPEIYAVLEAMNGLAGGERTALRRGGAAAGAARKERPCPCPKCNPADPAITPGPSPNGRGVQTSSPPPAGEGVGVRE